MNSTPTRRVRAHALHPLAGAAALLAFTLPGAAQTTATPADQQVVIIATQPSAPLTVSTDPRAPRQPVPAQDGADILKTIPGFSVIRKGGTDGDPVFRGMAGSRLTVLLDGEQIYGGCGGRMDPPTAYVFPESYDRLTVLKGPQSVRHGAGGSAATVMFERDWSRPDEPTTRFFGSLTAGSFGRNDLALDASRATPDGYVRAAATRTESDDYRDGDGNQVHSQYRRWSFNGAIGWTPDEHTRLELSAARSDGQAAYADRQLDGTKFARDNVGLKFERRRISALVEHLQVQAFRNYVDHVMENVTLRTATPPRLGNPDRLTVGGRVSTTLRLAEATRLDVGADMQDNEHTLRSGLGYLALPRTPDAEFSQRGVFGEIDHALSMRDRFVAGLRIDHWQASDLRATPLVTAGTTRSDTLSSGFARWERRLAQATLYAGLGHAQRFPDYWELISANKESETTNSAFLARPETTTQLDLGAQWRHGALSGSLSAFAAHIDDYLLVDGWNTSARFGKPPGNPVLVRNVDARSHGLEAGLAWAIDKRWQLESTLAWVRADNRNDGTPLAQQPPLEGRVAVNWREGAWSGGALLRVVAGQDRVDVMKGNIVGQDIGPSAGFSVFSLNASYRVDSRLSLSGGIDNLFDRTYAEHLSRAGFAVAGFAQTTRVNEPGRTLWFKATYRLD